MKISENEIIEERSLFTNQEEANTRMFFHIKNAKSKGYAGTLIISEDTDVSLLGIYTTTFLPEFTIYQKCGTEVRSRFVNIPEISHVIGETISECLPGLHVYTGCDTVSCFAGKGKVKSRKVVQRCEKSQLALSELGGQEKVSTDLYKMLEEFTCLLYGSKTLSDINELRYELFCFRKGKIDSSQLPLCRHALRKHIDRVNYQCVIWKSCFEQYPMILEPQEHGWTLINNMLTINWMTISPAPDSILEFLSYSCSKSCDNNRSTCRANNLKCIEMCKLKQCSNFFVENCDDVDEGNESSYSESEDDEN